MTQNIPPTLMAPTQTGVLGVLLQRSTTSPPNDMHNCQRSPFGSASIDKLAASRRSLWPPHPEGCPPPPSRCLPLEPLSHTCSLSHSVAPPVHVLRHPPASAHAPPPQLLPASRKHVHVMNFYFLGRASVSSKESESTFFDQLI